MLQRDAGFSRTFDVRALPAGIASVNRLTETKGATSSAAFDCERGADKVEGPTTLRRLAAFLGRSDPRDRASRRSAGPICREAQLVERPALHAGEDLQRRSGDAVAASISLDQTNVPGDAARSCATASPGTAACPTLWVEPARRARRETGSSAAESAWHSSNTRPRCAGSQGGENRRKRTAERMACEEGAAPPVAPRFSRRIRKWRSRTHRSHWCALSRMAGIHSNGWTSRPWRNAEPRSAEARSRCAGR